MSIYVVNSPRPYAVTSRNPYAKQFLEHPTRPQSTHSDTPVRSRQTPLSPVRTSSCQSTDRSHHTNCSTPTTPVHMRQRSPSGGGYRAPNRPHLRERQRAPQPTIPGTPRPAGMNQLSQHLPLSLSPSFHRDIPPLPTNTHTSSCNNTVATPWQEQGGWTPKSGVGVPHINSSPPKDSVIVQPPTPGGTVTFQPSTPPMLLTGGGGRPSIHPLTNFTSNLPVVPPDNQSTSGSDDTELQDFYARVRNQLNRGRANSLPQQHGQPPPAVRRCSAGASIPSNWNKPPTQQHKWPIQFPQPLTTSNNRFVPPPPPRLPQLETAFDSNRGSANSSSSEHNHTGDRSKQLTYTVSPAKLYSACELGVTRVTGVSGASPTDLSINEPQPLMVNFLDKTPELNHNNQPNFERNRPQQPSGFPYTSNSNFNLTPPAPTIAHLPMSTPPHHNANNHFAQEAQSTFCTPPHPHIVSCGVPFDGGQPTSTIDQNEAAGQYSSCGQEQLQHPTQEQHSSPDDPPRGRSSIRSRSSPAYLNRHPNDRDSNRSRNSDDTPGPNVGSTTTITKCRRTRSAVSILHRPSIQRTMLSSRSQTQLSDGGHKSFDYDAVRQVMHNNKQQQPQYNHTSPTRDLSQSPSSQKETEEDLISFLTNEIKLLESECDFLRAYVPVESMDTVQQSLARVQQPFLAKQQKLASVIGAATSPRFPHQELQTQLTIQLQQWDERSGTNSPFMLSGHTSPSQSSTSSLYGLQHSGKHSERPLSPLSLHALAPPPPPEKAPSPPNTTPASSTSVTPSSYGPNMF